MLSVQKSSTFLLNVEFCPAFTPTPQKRNKKATGQDAHMAELAETRKVEQLVAQSLVKVLGKQR